MDIPKYKIFEDHAEPYIKRLHGDMCVDIVVDIISEKPKEERDQITNRLNSRRLRELADYLDSIKEVSSHSSHD